MRGERWGVSDEGWVMKAEWWGVSYEEVNNFGIYFVRFQLQLDQTKPREEPTLPWCIIFLSVGAPIPGQQRQWPADTALPERSTACWGLPQRPQNDGRNLPGHYHGCCVTDGLCWGNWRHLVCSTHPNVIVIVFKGRVKQDLQPEVCLHHCKHFAWSKKVELGNLLSLSL